MIKVFVPTMNKFIKKIKNRNVYENYMETFWELDLENKVQKIKYKS